MSQLKVNRITDLNNADLFKPTLMTAINTTSGTYHDFIGMPSWVKRITVMFSGVSGSGTSLPQVQLGTSSGIIVTGYDSTVMWGTSYVASATGMLIGGGTASDSRSGSMIIAKLNDGIYTAFGIVRTSTTACMMSGGSVTLTGIIDRIRITTVNGTDTFDAGVVNIMYE